MKFKIYTRKGIRNAGIMLSLFILFVVMEGCMCISMPGKSYSGPRPPLEAEDSILKDRLEKDVKFLSDTIGQRNLFNIEGMDKSVDFIKKSFEDMGYEAVIQEYKADPGVMSELRGSPSKDENIYKNVIAEKKGTVKPDEIIVVGAHYDSVDSEKCPAANDNASGVAAVLALAEYFSNRSPGRTIRFVAFANEEPPYFWTSSMGSYVYAKSCREKNENIVGMLTTETIGYYSDDEGSQKYPFPFSYFYPSTGNFIALVGNTSSRSLVRRCVSIFRENVKFPCEGAALPSVVPGAGWSDHWSFWKAGYPGLMITDTAPFRYPYYHTGKDTADKIDFEKMEMVVKGICIVVDKLAEI